MNELCYTGTVKEGKLIIAGRKGFDQDMASMEGARLTIRINKFHRTRSTQQNAYYHSYVIPTVQEALVDLGFARAISREDVHNILRDKFLKEDLANYTGEFITRTKSTTELSTTDFMAYIENIQEWGSTFLSINILSPNEQATLDI